MGRLDIEAVREEVHRFDELIIRGPSPSASIYVAVQLCISRKNPQSTWAFLRMLGAGNIPRPPDAQASRVRSGGPKGPAGA